MTERRSLRRTVLGKRINSVRMEGNLYVFRDLDNEVIFRVGTDQIFDADGNFFFESLTGTMGDENG